MPGDRGEAAIRGRRGDTWSARAAVLSVVAVLAGPIFPAQVIAQENAAGGADAEQVDAPDSPSRFLRDVITDYRNYISIRTGMWLGGGTGAALAVHGWDEALRDGTQDIGGPGFSLNGGKEYGGLPIQVPLAVGWWIAGYKADGARAASTGRDLLRGQISAASWTYGLKFIADRTRPDGTVRSFPSGHTSSAFVTAIILQDNYGWKVGLPAFAAATYTAASRIVDNKHWASDVVFGAFMGMASGRTVTLHLRNTNLTMRPFATAVSRGVVVTWRPT